MFFVFKFRHESNRNNQILRTIQVNRHQERPANVNLVLLISLFHVQNRPEEVLSQYPSIIPFLIHRLEIIRSGPASETSLRLSKNGQVYNLSKKNMVYFDRNIELQNTYPPNVVNLIQNEVTAFMQLLRNVNS